MSSSASSQECANCGAQLQGRWCSACGQRQLTEGDRRLGHLLGQFAHELFHFEGKLPRTLAALVFKPGRLSAAYLQGQRVRYLSPIGLFLIINLLYFIAPPLTDFNLSLYDQYYRQPYSSLIQPLIDRRLEERELGFAALAAIYGEINLNLARSLIVAHLPILALALTLMLWQRRLFFAEHFIVATHLFTVLLLVPLVGLQLIRVATWVGALWFDNGGTLAGQVISVVLPIALAVHWWLALRRAYDLGWVNAFLVTLGLMVALVISHFAFRLVQFFVVFAFG